MSYALDLTATLPANYITTESTRIGAGNWAIVPEGGAFYTKDLIVTDSVTGIELLPLIHYRVLHTVPAAVLDSGKEVCAVILITYNVPIKVTIKRRLIGGPVYSVIGSDVQAIIDAADLDGLQTTAWGQLIGKPEQLPPEVHTHYDDQVYGLETVTYLLSKIEQGITTGDNALFGSVMQYISRQYAAANLRITNEFNTANALITTAINNVKFEPNQVVIFTDNSNPQTVFGYGPWERLPDGAIFMTNVAAQVGTIGKISFGEDYTGVRYAAWRYTGT